MWMSCWVALCVCFLGCGEGGVKTSSCCVTIHPTGTHTVNTLPCPGLLSALAHPPWTWAIQRTMESPKPVPSLLLEESAR